MAFDFLSEKNWRCELLVNGTSFGLWDRDEMTFGAENDDVTDPEFGQAPIGGRQTAEPVSVSRPFKRQRDMAVYRALKPVRGRNQSQLVVHVLDDNGLPVESAPIDTVDGVLLEVTLPSGNAGGDEASRIQCNLAVRA